MAHLRAHQNSKFWYLRFRDLDTGKWREESTHLLIADPKQTRQAQRLTEKKNAQELQLSGPTTGAFREWVADYIESHYSVESTRVRTLYAWERLLEWLNAKGLRHPREIRYEHAREYLEWRKRPELTRRASHNTALYELRFMGSLLNEAIRREFAERNVLLRLGIGRMPARLKPDLTDRQIAAARKTLANRAPWMQTIFEIQLYTGCRVSESSMPISDIDFRRRIITLTDAKRQPSDPRKRFEIPLDPALAGTLRGLKGRTAPLLTRERLSRYNQALTAATGTTSHSLRVTFVTRCHRAGLSEREAMRLVNHSTRLVHAVYSRLNADDVRSARARLVLPPPPSR